MNENQREINPLYEKMCQIYLIQGTRTIGEVMEKRALKYKTSERAEKAAETRKPVSYRRNARSLTGRALRAAAVCLSLLTLTAVLMICAYLGKENSGFFAKIVGVYSSNARAELSAETLLDMLCAGDLPEAGSSAF